MLKYNTTRGNLSRIAALYGDGEILLTLYKTRFWAGLFNRNEKSFVILFRELMRFNMAMFAFATGCMFRYKYGVRTIGLVLSLMTTIMMTGFNSSWLYWIFKPFFPFTAGIFFFFADLQFWHDFILEDIYSQYLFYYCWLFTTVAVFHSISIYTGFGNRNDPTKRGNSIIYALFFKYSKIPEYAVQAFMEPLIIGMAAFCFWHFADDKIFAVFLALSGLSLFFQEILDKAHQMQLRVPT